MENYIDLLIEHARLVRDCTEVLKEELENFSMGKFDQLPGMTAEVCMLEHDSDVLKRSIWDRLHKTKAAANLQFQILDIVYEQDMIADYAEEVALLLEMRNSAFPDEYNTTFLKLVNAMMESVELYKSAVEHVKTRKSKICRDCPDFERMYEGSNVGRCLKLDTGEYSGGFRSESSACEVVKSMSVFDLIDRVNDKEEEADELDRRLRKACFQGKVTSDPFEAMHLIRVIENIDMLINSAEDAAHRLRSFV